MDIVKLREQRVSPQYSRSYVYGSFLIAIGIFGGYLYSLDPKGWVLAIGIGLPAMLSIFISGAILKDDAITIDDDALVHKATTEKNTVKSKIFSKNFFSDVYYYPDIGMTVRPIFSFSALINGVMATTIIPFLLVFLLLTSAFKVGLILTIITTLLVWLNFAIINTMTLFTLWRQSQLPENQKNFVNMDFSHNRLVTICSHQHTRYYVDSTKRVDLLKLIATEGVEAAHFANLLIEKGATDAKTIESEIAIIEHIINKFVATTIETTNNFFRKHNKKKQAAEKIYLRDVAPQVRKEALELKSKIEQVIETLKNIEEAHKRSRLREDEESISVDDELLALTESALLPVPQFPEFHQLSFENIQNKVAAKNIVNGSLMTLIKAKELASSESDHKKIEQQINETKIFVKSLAANTPESEVRKERLLAAREQDALFLGADNNSINSIDNIIAIEKRYINSYDNTLPAGDK